MGSRGFVKKKVRILHLIQMAFRIQHSKDAQAVLYRNEGAAVIKSERPLRNIAEVKLVITTYNSFCRY